MPTVRGKLCAQLGRRREQRKDSCRGCDANSDEEEGRYHIILYHTIPDLPVLWSIFLCYPAVSHCIPLYDPMVSLCIPLYPAVSPISRCIPLYPAVSRCIPLYPAVSRCILPYTPYPPISPHIWGPDIMKNILQSTGRPYQLTCTRYGSRAVGQKGCSDTNTEIIPGSGACDDCPDHGRRAAYSHPPTEVWFSMGNFYM